MNSRNLVGAAAVGAGILIAFALGAGYSAKIASGTSILSGARLAVAALLGRSPIYPYGAAYENAVVQQERRSPQFDRTVLFIGDSITLSLATSLLGSRTENFGITGDGIEGVLYRLPRYDLRHVAVVVMAVGINDRRIHFDGFGRKYFQALRLIPESVPVIAVGILPINAAQAGEDMTDDIARARRDIEEACRMRPRCLYLPPPDALVDKGGQLPEAANIGDGIHLSTAGYRIWTAQLREALARTEHSAGPSPGSR